MTQPPKGSIRELKSRLNPKAYLKVKAQLKGSHWYIITWDSSRLVLRVDSHNIQFALATGAIQNKNQIS